MLAAINASLLVGIHSSRENGFNRQTAVGVEYAWHPRWYEYVRVMSTYAARKLDVQKSNGLFRRHI